MIFDLTMTSRGVTLLPIVWELQVFVFAGLYFVVMYYMTTAYLIGTGKSVWRAAVRLAAVILGLITMFAVLFMCEGITFTGNAAYIPTDVDALYFSIMTWTTVGYGDFVPKTELGRVYAAAEALCGYCIMALSIAIFLRVIDNVRRSRRRRAG